MNTNDLEDLKKELAKIEKQLDKNRGTVQQDGWQTQRYAKKMRNWDFYAKRKMDLISLIDDIENPSSINTQQ